MVSYCRYYINTTIDNALFLVLSFLRISQSIPKVNAKYFQNDQIHS